jgi:hypothetical protein
MVMEGRTMHKISLLAMAALVFALCGGAYADAAPLRHAKQFHPASAGSVAPTPTNVQSQSQGNGYVDYRNVGLSGNPDDCNKGCAVPTGQ